VISKEVTGLDNMKTACDELNGIMASEDLKDSENAEKAEVSINTFRGESDENKNSGIVLGITAKDVDKPLTENNNDFAYSDGTDFDVSSFAYKWIDNDPDYDTDGGKHKCVYLRGDGKITNYECVGLTGNALCFVEEDCANSDSERSRLNLPVFALFMAGSVFKTFFELVGPAF